MHTPANKGATCAGLKLVYSRALRKRVHRCARFVGGRVGLRRAPARKPYSARCVQRKSVYSRALHKRVWRCSKMRWPERPAQNVLRAPLPSTREQSVLIRPIRFVGTEAATPAWAALLRNRMAFMQPRDIPGYKNITQSPRGRERVAASIEHLVRGYPMPAATAKFLQNEQRRMRGS